MDSQSPDDSLEPGPAKSQPTLAGPTRDDEVLSNVRARQNEVTAHQVAAHSRLAVDYQPVLRLGRMLLAAGASAFRVKASMATVARSIGIQEHQAVVTLNEIIATAYSGGTFRTEVAEERSVGVNATTIDRVNRYVSNIPAHVTPDEVDRELDQIARQKPPYGPVLNALAAGFACAGFSFLNGGGLVQIISVFIAALLGQALRRWLLRRGYNHFGVWMVSSAFAGMVFIGCVVLIEAFTHTEYPHHGGIVAATLFLVPGFPLVTSIIEMVRQDFSASIPRMVYSIGLVIAAASALWVVTHVFNWPIANSAPPALPPFTQIPLQLVASFAASFGFAVLFVAQPKACLWAASIGAVVNTGRLVLVETGLPPQLVIAAAALLIGLAAALVARHTKYSRVSLSVPGAVIMIPGTYLYQAMAAANNQQMGIAVENLSSVMLSLTAVGVGLAAARLLTDHTWRVDKTATIPEIAFPFGEDVGALD